MFALLCPKSINENPAQRPSRASDFAQYPASAAQAVETEPALVNFCKGWAAVWSVAGPLMCVALWVLYAKAWGWL